MCVGTCTCDFLYLVWTTLIGSDVGVSGYLETENDTWHGQVKLALGLCWAACALPVIVTVLMH